MSTILPDTRTDKLATPVQFLKGVGPKLAEQLQKLGLETVQDVLFCLPRRYEDRRNLPPIGQIRVGQWVTVRGRLIGFDGRPTRGGKVVIRASISDKTGTVSLVWFNQPWVSRKLQGYKGEILAYGQVKESGFAYEISSPEYELIEDDSDEGEFARIVPVYPLTEGVRQSLVRRAAVSAIDRYLGDVIDPLPANLRQEQRLKPLAWSLRQIHMPESEENRLEAKKRLIFDEFFLLQLALEQKRLETHSEVGISFPISQLKSSVVVGEIRRTSRTEKSDPHLFVKEATGLRYGSTLLDEAKSLFPFDLTHAQDRVIKEVWADMERPYPMNRLIQGDVGSGKTAVAACAMLAAVRCGYQAAIMAPTEILAEQHFRNLKAIFEPVGIVVALLVGKQSAGKKKEVVGLAKEAKAHILVGTHALIQESVSFDRLGLVVIDEQHRFGVMQRAALRQKGINPDVLVMTATPIPRTLTMTLYGDLDVSILDELPPGRVAIKTHWKKLDSRDKVYEQARELIKQGRQAYVVCPLVAESEKMMAQAAEELHYRLSESVYPELRVGLLHGQMKPKDKDTVMDQFRSAKLDILVSTTVIEVGVDVPNASVMIIEDANRFGLAQLHQLRGRVGRGTTQSYCILLADSTNEDAEARMQVLVDTNDGFKLAEEDLRLRGPGEMLGTKQSGNLDFKIADLVQDAKLLEISRHAAQKLLESDPYLSKPEHRILSERVKNRRSQQADAVIS